MIEAYRVVAWDEAHENNESRKIKELRWYAKPNKHDGLGYRQLVREPEKEALYGVWSAILDIASKAPKPFRGWLIRDGKPLDAAMLSIMTGFREALFEKALLFFSSPSVGWLALQPVPSPGVPGARPEVPGESPGVPGARPGNPPAYDREGRIGKDPQERERGGGGEQAKTPTTGTSLAAVQASRTQAGVLMVQIRELEGRKDQLEQDERVDLRKKKAALRELQKKQAAGNFND